MTEVDSQPLLAAARTTIHDAVERSESNRRGEFNSPEVTEILVWMMLVPLLINLLAGSIQTAIAALGPKPASKAEIEEIKRLLTERKCTVKTISRSDLHREIETAVRRAFGNDEAIKAAMSQALQSWATDAGEQGTDEASSEQSA
ncbi:MAG: hypothetical protein AAFQ31_05565 [Planctomycetota bacterium]